MLQLHGVREGAGVGQRVGQRGPLHKSQKSKSQLTFSNSNLHSNSFNILLFISLTYSPNTPNNKIKQYLSLFLDMVVEVLEQSFWVHFLLFLSFSLFFSQRDLHICWCCGV